MKICSHHDFSFEPTTPLRPIAIIITVCVCIIDRALFQWCVCSPCWFYVLCGRRCHPLPLCYFLLCLFTQPTATQHRTDVLCVRMWLVEFETHAVSPTDDRPADVKLESRLAVAFLLCVRSFLHFPINILRYSSVVLLPKR